MRLAPTFFPFLTPFEVEGNLGYSVAGNVLSQSEGGRRKRVPVNRESLILFSFYFWCFRVEKG